MKTLNLNVIALAISLAFTTAAMAQSMSKTDYKAGKNKISAEYKLAKTNCDLLSGNPKDICVAEAKGNEKVALADLEASYKPSREHRYDASLAKAKADYAVAMERCDDNAGNAKDVCVKEAKAAKTTAEADAKALLKTSDANATANKKSSEARNKANEKSQDANKDAVEAKLAAEYKVAKEKCDTLAGNAKDVCVNEAKVRFAQ
ncbi:MAG: hypothetical protein ABL892_09115 [Thiobacillaceae bacterium]